VSLPSQESGVKKSQADLLFEAQQRKQNRFRLNVILSWISLLVFLVFLFSGVEIKSSSGKTEISYWRFRTVTENNRDIRKKIQNPISSLAVGIPGKGMDLKTIIVDG
jgi:hypothetical protein